MLKGPVIIDREVLTKPPELLYGEYKVFIPLICSNIGGKRWVPGENGLTRRTMKE